MKFNCTFVCCLLFASLLQAQAPDLIGIPARNHVLHKKNAGKIFFTSAGAANNGRKPPVFLTSYTLTNKSDLFFVAYFKNSLTNFKHRLSPASSAEDLFRMGNFEFCLLIDGKEAYRSNLLPGAPSASIQDTATSLYRPLIDNKDGQGSWSESFWNRFLMNGGDSLLTDGSHRLRMEIRPYVKEGDLIRTGVLMAAGDLPIRVKRHPKIDLSRTHLSKLVAYDGLPVSSAPFDTRKIRELKGQIDAGVFKKINSIIVVRDGRLLLEEYFNGENRNTLHDPRSVGKSFASTLIGAALKDGFLKDEQQQLKEFYDLSEYQHASSAKGSTSLEELLTMSSGFDGNDEDSGSPGNEENMYPTGDWVRFALELPFQDSLRRHWHYFTAGVILLGDILNKTVKGGLAEYADKVLFKPLRISRYKWQYTPQQVPNTAGGIRMNALDFAKYGQMYKNGGSWLNRQILSKEWVEKTFTRQRKIAGRHNEFYGYLFWNKTFQVKDKAYEAFYCAGNGGNYILIFRDQPLVIVIMASAYGQPYAHAQVTKMLTEYLLPAVAR